MPTPTAPRRSRRLVLLFIAVCLVAVNMRMTITGIGPLLEQIAADLGTSPAALGGLASVPLAAWAIVSPLTHGLSMRFGLERTVGWALVALMIGTAWRSLPGPPISLWLGTALIGAALAIGNVLMPAVIRRDFGDRIPLVMGVYTALLGGLGAVSAGVVVPISHLEGGDGELGWRLALLTTGAMIPVALVAWVLAARAPRAETPVTDRGADPSADGGPRRDADRLGEAAHAGDPVVASPAAPRATAAMPVGRRIWRDPVAWFVALYMGLQSTIFYMLATWLAPIETDSGVSPVDAGISVMLLQLVSIVGSLALPLMYRGRMRRWLAAIVPLVVGASFAAIVLSGPALPWIVLCGLGCGTSLSISLLLMAVRARDAITASALSGMAQSIGYLIAAPGPALFGLAHEASGAWIWPLALLLAASLGQALVGLAVGRERFVFDRR
ncbi:MFS transporter [Leucobacter allii]|uniref:MFS transporter n=1 Tax=Leucobacter allii TaxID=2932247 RepID=UPI001FD0AE8B|nr:MFS transporter [Leucobacter allii]UOR01946.1 MFS transporter [Leucobacter allii]